MPALNSVPARECAYDSGKSQKKASPACTPLHSVIFRIVSEEFRLDSICRQLAGRYLVRMSFSLSPLTHDLATDRGFIFAGRRRLDFNPHVGEFIDAGSKVFEWECHDYCTDPSAIRCVDLMANNVSWSA